MTETMKVYLATLGCAKNEVDSALMREVLLRRGCEFTDDEREADVFVVNTCAFIQPAVEESIEAILDLASLDRVRNGNAKVIVTGCLASRYGDELESELPEVAGFLRCDQEDSIAEAVFSALPQTQPCTGTPLPAAAVHGTFAYVKISDGCSRCCSYCMIPKIRGPYRSFAFEEILADVEFAVAAGAREICLVGQDTGLWGLDLPEKKGLAWLLDELAGRFPETWFRTLYIQPAGITDELLSTIAAHGNICRYLDMPLQHCDSEILGRMNRSGSSQEYLRLVERIRAAIPDIALRTTLMVGFPGETDEAFEALKEFVEEAAFDYAGVFAFSPEEGSPAAELSCQVPDDVKSERFEELSDLVNAVSDGVIASRIGSAMDVLVEGVEEDGQLFGRSQYQAPEVDGETYVDSGNVGEKVRVRIVDTLMYEMEGERIDV